MVLFVVLFLAFCIVFVNGATDAVNSVSTCVSSGSMKMKSAVLLSAVFNFLGVSVMGAFFADVAITVRDTVRIENGQQVYLVLISCLSAVILWSLSAWYFGLPTSESHGLVASLAGAGWAMHGISGIDITELAKALYGVPLSSIAGLISGAACVVFIRRLPLRADHRFYKRAQVIGCACMSFMHGGQDGSKLLGIFMIALGAEEGIPVFYIAAVSIVMMIGTAIGGKRIIKTIGTDMVSLSYAEGFCADISSAVCLFLFSVFGGIPASTTQTKASAMIGASLFGERSYVNGGIVKNMVSAWLLTFPACFMISAVITRVGMLVL